MAARTSCGRTGGNNYSRADAKGDVKRTCALGAGQTGGRDTRCLLRLSTSSEGENERGWRCNPYSRQRGCYECRGGVPKGEGNRCGRLFARTRDFRKSMAVCRRRREKVKPFSRFKVRP